MNDSKMTYTGLWHDTHGMTMLGRVVLDGWLFKLIPETEDCSGWNLQRMQGLMSQVEAQWDAYGNLPSRLPDDLRERHSALYARAAARAREQGWDPELGDDD
jgi:hypothetical protein